MVKAAEARQQLLVLPTARHSAITAALLGDWPVIELANGEEGDNEVPGWARAAEKDQSCTVACFSLNHSTAASSDWHRVAAISHLDSSKPR